MSGRAAVTDARTSTAAGAVLVTGASSGLGRAVATELGARGREVVLLARDAGRLRETADAVEAAGGRARVVTSDVTDEARLAADLHDALAETPLSLVVHAAGILELAPLEALEPKTLRRMLDVNVVGTAIVARTTRERLIAGSGRLVVVSSVAGLFPLPGGFTGYGASKWAVRGWAEIARRELASHGVGLTVAYPSILDTPMARDLEGTPAVYRAFPWHPPRRAARALLRDATRGRRESYVTWSDRLAAWCAGAFPHLFAAVLHAVVRWRAR